LVLHYVNLTEKQKFLNIYKEEEILSLSGLYSFVPDQMRVLIYSPELEQLYPSIKQKLVDYIN